MRVINDHAERTGKKVMYACNLTGDIDQMRTRHDLLRELGGTCAMVSLNSIGLAGLIAFARHTEMPIHAHRNGWGYLSRHPMLGWSYVAWQKIWRLAGADHMHVNGLANKFSEDDDSVIRSAQECLTPLFDDKPCLAMPVFSSGQTAVQPPETYRRLGSADLIYTAGGGIMGHPGGPKAGVSSLREAWKAALTGIDAQEYARTHPALAAALGSFGA
jgi:ribulose-bisphosphate carboxylase large chain